MQAKRAFEANEAQSLAKDIAEPIEPSLQLGRAIMIRQASEASQPLSTEAPQLHRAVRRSRDNRRPGSGWWLSSVFVDGWTRQCRTAIAFSLKKQLIAGGIVDLIALYPHQVFLLGTCRSTSSRRSSLSLSTFSSTKRRLSLRVACSQRIISQSPRWTWQTVPAPSPSCHFFQKRACRRRNESRDSRRQRRAPDACTNQSGFSQFAPSFWLQSAQVPNTSIDQLASNHLLGPPAHSHEHASITAPSNSRQQEFTQRVQRRS